MNKEKQLKTEMIGIGKKLYSLRLTAAKGGNLSAALEKDVILITRSGTCLGELKEDDILKANICSGGDTKGLSTEFPLHSLIHQNFPDQVVIHCHPPLANAYFYAHSSLQSVTFENRLFLGNVPVIEQSTPSVTRPERSLPP
ncbi:MAG: class II aldolase/adducin family protein [Candidatus Omnitrophota bacterium]